MLGCYEFQFMKALDHFVELPFSIIGLLLRLFELE